MKLRGLTIAVVVLATLSGALYWSNHRKAAEIAAVKASPDAPLPVVSLNPADVVRVSIHRKDQPPVDLSRDSSGKWRITAPKELTADQNAVSGVVTTLSSLNADRVIDDHPSDVARYGLATPALEVDATTKDNKTQRLLVGDQTPAGTSYYLMLGGDSRLLTFAGYNKTGLDKTSNDLREKHLLTADVTSATQIEFIPATAAAKQDITFARNKDGWQIIKPQPLRTQNELVGDLIRTLQGVRMDTDSGAPGLDDAKNAAGFTSAAPFAVAKVTGSFGTQEVEVRKEKDKDDYYAKSSAIPGVYKVAAADAVGLKKSLDDFRAKNLFDFGVDEPNRFEVHNGAKAYFVSHSGEDWWGPDGKRLDPVTVLTLVGQLRDLSASKFPTSGFTTPSVDITVVSGDGKLTEEVLIAKNGASYVAKRDGEQGLYEVPASTVEGILQLAAGMKPVSTTEK